MREAIRERKLFSEPRGVRGVGTHTVSEAAVKNQRSNAVGGQDRV